MLGKILNQFNFKLDIGRKYERNFLPCNLGECDLYQLEKYFT